VTILILPERKYPKGKGRKNMNTKLIFKRISRAIRANARAFNRRFCSYGMSNGFQSRWLASGGNSEWYEEEIVKKVIARTSASKEFVRILGLLRANSIL
jgi:hypothetical protein